MSSPLDPTLRSDTTSGDDGDEKGSGKRSMMERHLMKTRAVLVFGAIEPKETRRIVKQLLVLDSVSHEEPIRVYINSPGGVADDGFAIYDVLRFVKAPVITVVTGLAASAATIVMLGADKDKRFVLPNSRIMLHQPSSGVRGTASDIAISAQEILRLRKKANELFARETGHDIKKIEDDMTRDFWMSAEEAVDYGLLTKIITSSTDLP